MIQNRRKNTRILSIYDALSAGNAVNKNETAQRYGVDARTIQRDIDDIRSWLSERTQAGDVREIIYDRKRHGFVLSGGQFPMMTNGEILAVSKILLESRAFPKKKMKELLDKLVSGCVPQRNMKLVSDLLANEAFPYVELQRPTDVQETW